MAFAMHRTEIEKFIAECVALLILSEDILQRLRKLSKPRSLGPLAIALIFFSQSDV